MEKSNVEEVIGDWVEKEEIEGKMVGELVGSGDSEGRLGLRLEEVSALILVIKFISIVNTFVPQEHEDKICSIYIKINECVGGSNFLL